MAYKWQALFAVCFGTFMATMDFSIVNVALPTLSDEFNRAPDVVVWASLISSLLVTGLTLTAGRVGDLFGRKRIYITGWMIFTIGMATAGLAQNLEQLIAFRALQCVGVALAIANGNAIVTGAFPDSERGRALGTVGAVVGAGLMSGPIFGGLILNVFDWRALFYLRVPIGLTAMLLAFLFIRDTPGQEGPKRLDIPGAVALFVTLACAVLAVNRGQQWGWSSPVILGLFFVAAASLAVFIRIDLREPSPIISLSLFRIPTFAIPVVSLVLNFLGQSAVTFLMPFYLIKVIGHSTAGAGLIIATVPLMMLVFSPISGYVSDRFGFRYQTAAGVILISAG
ncbi:MAG TPA: MFS transporter, partial [Tepidiformaceae bacterium]|nr:MFS transporter [Tepidiformaceae bacterium]